MAKVIGIMGISGAGKTTSLRNLDPATTFYIDCDGKGMTWKGWATKYNEKEKNYIKTTFPQMVERRLIWLDGKDMDEYGNITESKNKNGLKFKVVVVDTLNSLMIAEEDRNRKRKDYDKWNDLADSIWGILETAIKCRDDLAVIILAHSETVTDDSGYRETHIATSGRKLRKRVPESKMNTVLLAETTEEGEHVLIASKANTTAKEGFMDLLAEPVIPNDINIVLKALEEF